MQEQRINWYPGHMAKTRRLLQEQVKHSDLIIELCDARLPWSSRNPDLIRIAGSKRHILLMNKVDLADPVWTDKWLNAFRKKGITVFPNNCLKMQSKELLRIIEQETRDFTERAESRGIRKTLKAMVVGVPNVGKSTLINRLCGKSIAETGDRPGITRNPQWIRIHPYLELLDTPGLLWPRLDDQDAAKRLCYLGMIRDDIIDLESLTLSFLEEMAVAAPDSLQTRFHVLDPSLRGISLLDAVCQGRGWLLKNHQYDYERCSHMVLDEFRAGKLGRMTLEFPFEAGQGVNQNDHPGNPSSGIDTI